MGRWDRKGGGVEEMEAEHTLAANQKDGSTGLEAWQEAEHRSVGVCPNRCVQCLCYFTGRCRKMQELYAFETFIKAWYWRGLWLIHSHWKCLQGSLWTFGEQLELGRHRVWWDNHWWTFLPGFPKCMVVDVGAACSFIQPSGQLTWSDGGDVRKAGCYFTAC